VLTRLSADEFGRSGVRANAVEAGPTETPGTAVTPRLTDGLGAFTALGRAAKADEIANAITFLASPAASYINGAVLQATGGQLAAAMCCLDIIGGRHVK
jgi:NAD(P)-dependent dehydrogenase (short-subunit alcohol dehydrogenase family)